MPCILFLGHLSLRRDAKLLEIGGGTNEARLSWEIMKNVRGFV